MYYLAYGKIQHKEIKANNLETLTIGEQGVPEILKRLGKTILDHFIWKTYFKHFILEIVWLFNNYLLLAFSLGLS